MTWLRHAADWFALEHRGYQFWSGIGSGSPLLAAVYVNWRRHNCHVAWCWRVQFRGHPDDEGHIVCRKHYRNSSSS